MRTFFIYIIQVNLAIIVLYILYKVAFQKDTFFLARRWYLIGSVLFSFIHPFFSIPFLRELSIFKRDVSSINGVVDVGELSSAGTIIDHNAEISWLNWEVVVASILIMGMIFILFKFSVQLISVFRIKSRSKRRAFGNITFYNLEKEIAPFSFFNWIFIHSESHTSDKLKQIIIHEQIHAKGWHSIDMLIMELSLILLWWNPLFWMMKRDVVINLEYIADNRVLDEGINKLDYQYNLLDITYNNYSIQLVNNFNISQLKQRIMMMNSEKTPLIKLAKYFLILPIVLFFITINSIYAQKEDPKKEDKRDKRITFFHVGDSTAYKPIYVIDGVKMNKGFEINEIDPAEIESISILKDSTATSMYGDDGKNGVVIIKKKGVTVIHKNDLDTDSKKSEKNDVFVVVEEQPEFPGGAAAMMQFLKENVQYPQIAVENGIEGRVILSFIVEKDGSISDIDIVRGVDPSLDMEAKRVIASMPDWKAGRQKDQEVRVRFTLPIVFRLPPKEEAKTEGTNGDNK